MSERRTTEDLVHELLDALKETKPRAPWFAKLAMGLAIGVAFCLAPTFLVRDTEAHGTRSEIRRGLTLPATCKGAELFIHETPTAVLKTSDPSSCGGPAVWEEAMSESAESLETTAEWDLSSSSYFDELVKVTVTGGATNTLVLDEATFDDGELQLNLITRRLRITVPASIDLSTIEASGNTSDDALPFSYAVWVEETGGPGTCANDSLDCAVLSGTRNAITAQEYSLNALIALPIVQTPATVSADGPLFVDPLFHALFASSKNVQDTAKTGDGLSSLTAVLLGGDGTTFLTVNEVAWSSVHGIQVVPAFDMATERGYILDSLANDALQEPFDAVNSMADISEQLDGTLFGTTDFFHLAVFQGVYEIASVSYSRVFLNPPTCVYAANQLSDALIDLNSCTNFAVPVGFSGLKLIGRLLVKNDTDLINTIDTPSATVASALGGIEGVGNTVGPGIAVDGNVVVFDGASGHRVRDSGTPYPPLMMQISRNTDQILISGVDEFIVWNSESFDDDDWFPGVDNEHIEFGFTGRVACTLSLRADVDPVGAPKELCLRAYIDDVLPAGVEYGCFLTSDAMDTAAVAHDVFEVVPGTDLSFEVLGTADLDMRAALNCERKR